MKNLVSLIFIYCLLIASVSSHAQIITTFAGNGSATISGDNGPATAAGISYSGGGSFDGKGNYYFVNGQNNNTVRMIDTFGIIHTVAGNGTAGYSGDSGPATDAQLNYPWGAVADDSGNIFIADSYNYRVRKVTAATHIITTITGNGISGFNGDGVATSASIQKVIGLCLDPFGNVYLLDSGVRIRKIDPSGMITTIAGNGIYGGTGDGGPATNAHINTTYAICSDIGGNIYFGTGLTGAGIRKINRITGIINPFAGNGNGVYNGDEINADAAAFNPHHIFMDPIGKMYISDFSNDRIRMIDNNHIIHTIAGNGTGGFSGDSGPAINAQINHPEGVVVDKCGNVYIGDTQNKRIRKVTINPNCWPLEMQDIESKEDKLLVYPNPAYDELTINYDALLSHITITNITGQEVYNTACSSHQTTLPIRHLAPGLYFLKINDQKVVRFVKE